MDRRAALNRHAREQVAGLAGMNAHAHRGLVEEPVDDVDLLLDGLERLQALAELHLVAWPFAHQ